MNVEDEIRRNLKHDPFRPFFIRLTSGERIEVNDRHQMAIIRDNNTVAVLSPRPGGIFIRKNEILAVDE
jgi:hypothetical protein